MHDLTERIATAQASAAAAAGDIRIKEFLQALRIFAGPADGSPKGVWIDCHERRWFRSLTVSDLAAVETLSCAELPILITSWVQEAIDKGSLSLSNPPEPYYRLSRSGSDISLPVGSLVTCVYDQNGRLSRRISDRV